MEKTEGTSKYIHIKVNAEFHRELKTHCAAQDTKMKTFATQALLEKMEADRNSSPAAPPAAKPKRKKR